MIRSKTFDLVRDLLDHELVDSEGVSCGMVDDVELKSAADGLTVVALLAGPGVWSRRLPAILRLSARWMGATRRVRIPFDVVERIAESIHLKSKATDLGLGVVDRRVARRLARVMGPG
jgi:sporulation protein YlmC with PRC-barrel domain